MLKSGKITVLGSFVVDLMGRADHMPVVGETTKGSSFKMGPGGKGSNQAIAAKRLGADINFITKIGEDDFGKMALRTLENEGFHTEYILVDKEVGTGAALILVDETNGLNEILVVPGACENIKLAELDNLKF